MTPQEKLQALAVQEQELERLRALLNPQYWPKVYEMLKRVRAEIRQLEQSIDDELNGRDRNVAS